MLVLERTRALLELKEKREGKEQKVKQAKQAKAHESTKTTLHKPPVKELISPATLQTAELESALEPELSTLEEKEPLYLKFYSIPPSAGAGSMMFDDETPFEEKAFDTDVVPAGADFVLCIRGDSMESVIHDDDIVFVKQQETLENGNVGIFIYNGESYCKRYDRENGILIPLNPAYEDIILCEWDECSIVGKIAAAQVFFRPS